MNFRKVIPSLVALVIFLIIWELCSSVFKIVDTSLYSSPSEIFHGLTSAESNIFEISLSTFQASFYGWLISIFLGLIFGIMLHLVPILKRAFLPYAVFFQTIPIIAIAPLLVVQFGFGIKTIVSASVFVSIFPIIASTVIGLSQVPKQKIELFTIYRATTLQKLFKLELPYSLTHVFSGVKTACGLSIIGTITGEFIAGGGLGGFIDVAMTQQRVDLIFAALMILVFWGIFLNGLLNLTIKSLRLLVPFHYIKLS